MNQISEDFFYFILPNGTIFPCPGSNGIINFPWGEALDFIREARKVFSSHQIDNAFGCLACDDLTGRYEAGDRSIDLMWDISSQAEHLRNRWNMDN